MTALSNKRYLPEILIYSVTAAMLYMTAFKGFDLTDEGWQLAKSWWLMKGDTAHNADLIWGSSFVNGLWLKLRGAPSVWWSRFGFVLFFPLIPVTVFMTVKEFSGGRTAAVSVMTVFLFFYRNFLIYPVINYYYLPVLFSLISFYYLIKNEGEPRFLYLFLSGAAAGACVHLKFTYILIIPLFIFYSLISPENRRIRSYASFYSGFLATLAAGFAVLFFAGGFGSLAGEGSARLSVISMFSTFFGSGQVNSSLDYSISGLTSKYLKDIYTVLLHFFLPAGLFFLSGLISSVSRKAGIVLWLVSGVLLIIYKYLTGHDYLLMVSIFTAVYTILLISVRREKRTFHLVTGGTLYLFILSFAGSGMGLYSGLISAGFMGFAAAVTAYTFRSADRGIVMKCSPLALIIFIVYIQATKKFVAYREADAVMLNTPFRTEELRGISSFGLRAGTVDQFMDYAKQELRTSDRVIFAVMPVFYYLLDRRPLLSETFETVMNYDDFTRELNSAAPDVIVFPVQSPRGNFWPMERNRDFWKTDKYEITSAPYYNFYYNYMMKKGFRRIWENGMFYVYRKVKNGEGSE